MFVILYRWRVDPEKIDTFIENWSIISQHYVEHCGSLGSRLHRGSDGIFYAYAKWPDLQSRERAFLDVRVELARLHMKDAVIEVFPETHLEVIAEYLPAIPDANK